MKTNKPAPIDEALSRRLRALAADDLAKLPAGDLAAAWEIAAVKPVPGPLASAPLGFVRRHRALWTSGAIAAVLFLAIGLTVMVQASQGPGLDSNGQAELGLAVEEIFSHSAGDATRDGVGDSPEGQLPQNLAALAVDWTSEAAAPRGPEGGLAALDTW
jgi:hypothetical protein